MANSTAFIPAAALVAALAAALTLAACQPAAAPSEAAQPSAMLSAQDENDNAAAVPADAPAPADGQAASSGFDPGSVPESTATLPPFPFFKTPEGLTSVQDEKLRNSSFDVEHMIVGDKIVALEGKVFRDTFPLENPDRPYSALEFQRNYENAIRELGGSKVSTAQFTEEVVGAFGGRDAVDAHFHGTCAGFDCENNTYLIRKDGKEFWTLVSTGTIPLHGRIVVLERHGMASKLGFLDASQMKKAIDADGKVALHINFDVDKASLRPDAQPVIAEIHKLLTQAPDLKLSIEGHTDSTGTPEHNKTLSTERAASVREALVGRGIDAARLSSTGFGQEKPVADNGTEAGRAKNRRVELVKRD